MTVPQVPVATHFFRQRYLYSFAPQAEVFHHVRTQALEAESTRLPEILASWTALQPTIGALTERERGLAETIQLMPLPPDCQPRINAICTDPLFQKTFAHHGISFQMVEVDKLIAAQRSVNLDYAERLQASYPTLPTMAELMDICLSPTRDMEAIQHLEVAPNTHVFSSPNSDIRFLGSFVKPLTPEDLAHAALGGLPAAAIIAFVGYGGAPINVLQAGPRVVLNNGFHRVYALRSLGVTHLPVVVQQIRNGHLEFPANVLGLPREYLLADPRPVLIKDFFEPDFAITLKVRERIKTVTLGINLGQHDVPS